MSVSSHSHTHQTNAHPPTLPYTQAQAWPCATQMHTLLACQVPTWQSALCPSLGFLSFSFCPASHVCGISRLPASCWPGTKSLGLGRGRAAPQTEVQLGFVLGRVLLTCHCPLQVGGCMSSRAGLCLGTSNHRIHSSRKPSLLLLCSLHSACQQPADLSGGWRGRARAATRSTCTRLARGLQA